MAAARATALSSVARRPGRTLADDYHVGIVSLLLAAALALVGMVGLRRLRPGSAVLLWLVGVSAALTLAQPTCHSRFVHSWLAVAWAISGLGLALLASLPLRSLAARLTLAGAPAVALLALAIPTLGRAGHAPEGGPRSDIACSLDLSDSYLPHLDLSRRAVILSNYPLKFLAQWTHQQRSGRTEPTS